VAVGRRPAAFNILIYIRDFNPTFNKIGIFENEKMVDENNWMEILNEYYPINKEVKAVSS